MICRRSDRPSDNSAVLGSAPLLPAASPNGAGGERSTSPPAPATMAPTLAILLLAWCLLWREFGLSELGQDGFLGSDLGLGSLLDLLRFAARDVHPPLFYAALHGWFPPAGHSYLAAKYPVIAAALLTIAVVERLGARLGGPAVGRLAALLLLLSPTFLRLGSTVRDFIPGLCLTCCTLLLTVRLLAAPAPRARRRDAALLAAATALALLTSYLHLAVLAAELLLCRSWPGPAAHRLLATPRSPMAGSDAGRRAAALGLLGGSVLALPWYGFAMPHLLGKLTSGTTASGHVPAAPALAGLAAALVTAIVGRSGDLPATLAATAWCAALGLGIAVAWRTPGDPSPSRRLLLVALAAGGAEVAILLWRWQAASSLSTYAVVLLPPTVLIQTLALARLPRSWWPAATGAALAFAAVGQVAWYAALVHSQPIDYTHDAAFTYLAQHMRTGDGLIFSDHARRAQYALAGDWAAAGLAAGPWPAGTDGGCSGGVSCAVILTSDGSQDYLHSTLQEAEATVAGLASPGRRLWYAESGEAPDQLSVGRRALATFAYLAWEQHFPGTDLQLYIAGAPDVRRQPDAVLGGAVGLDAAAFTSRAAPGEALLVDLTWRDLHPLGAAYTVFVHLDDAAGQLVAQQDGSPEAGLLPLQSWQAGETIDDRHGVLLPTGLRPGIYRLNVGLYLGTKRLTLPDGGNAIQLGAIRVDG